MMSQSAHSQRSINMAGNSIFNQSDFLAAPSIQSLGAATITPSSSALSLTSVNTNKPKNAQGGLQNCIPFPYKLHEMLEYSANEGLESIISWLPNNRSFKVFNVPRFVNEVMPRFFNQTKYKSFQRQLNIWGFERIQESGTERSGYCHPYLLRGNTSLCRNMSRTKVKSSGVQSAAKSSLMLLREQKKALEASRRPRSSPVPSRSQAPISATQEEDISPSFQQPKSKIQRRGSILLDGLFDDVIIEEDGIIVPRHKTNERRISLSLSSSAQLFAPPQDGDCMLFEGRTFHFVSDYKSDYKSNQS